MTTNLLNLLERSTLPGVKAQHLSEKDFVVSSAEAGLVLVVGVSGSGRKVVAAALAEELGCIDWASLRALTLLNKSGTGFNASPVQGDGLRGGFPARLYVGEIVDADRQTLQAVVEFIELGGQVVAELHAAGPADAMSALRNIYEEPSTQAAWEGLMDLLAHRSDALILGLSRPLRGGPVFVERRLLSDLRTMDNKASI